MDVITVKFTARNELDFYPLSPSMEVYAQPASVREHLEKRLPGIEILERNVLRRWHGYALILEYVMMTPRQKVAQINTARPVTSAEHYEEYWS
jgi:hypothetical protein